MAKVLKTAAVIVGAVALVASGVGAAGGLGIIAATTATAIGTVAGVAATALTLGAAALTKQPAATISGNQTQFTASLDQGLPWALGRTRTAGCAVHDITYDADGSTNNAFQSFYGVWSADRCNLVEATQIDNVTVDFSAPNATAAGTYKDWMWHRSQLGMSPEAGALKATDALPYPPGWSTSAMLSGMAAFSWTLRFDFAGKIYPSGTVPQKADIIQGALAWDPRLDSTYPGGSGSQRQSDPTTWAWTENPFLLALKWALGIWSNGKKVMGIGIALAAINVDSAVQAANVADANGWKAGGVVYSTDPKYDVLKKICAAGSGEPLRVGGMLTFMVDAPRVSLDTITTADLVAKCTVPSGARMKDRINGVIPTYREPTQDWQLVPATKVTIADYVTADGRPRTKAMTWELVQQVAQVAQLATYAICNAREIDGVVLPCRLRWVGYKPGDAVTVSSSVVAMDNQLIVLRKRSLDPASGAVTFTARTETTAKHALALGQTTTAPPTPALATVDRTGLLNPGVSAAWSAIVDDNGARSALLAQAAQAATDAQSALGDLSRIGSDGFLNAGSEKLRVVQDWNTVAQEAAPLEAQADALGVDRTTFDAARNNLSAYLTSLTPAWFDTTQDTAIAPTTWNGKWNDYYFAKVSLIKAMTAASATKANFSGITDDNGQLTALKNQSSTAAANASTALGSLAVIASSGYLHAGADKLDVVQDWTVIAAESAPLNAQAAAQGIDPGALNTARNNLSAYLTSLTPAWFDTTQDTAINATTWNGVWSDYYHARVLLIDSMTAAAATTATWDGVYGTGKDSLIAQAAAAATASTSALADLSKIGSSGYLKAGNDKRKAMQDWQVILDEGYPLETQALQLGVDITAYDAARTALAAYLVSLTPSWNDATQDTAIVATVWIGKWSDYYFAKAELLQACSTTAAQTASPTNGVKLSLFEKGVLGWEKRYDPSGIAGAPFVYAFASGDLLILAATATAAGQVFSYGNSPSGFRVNVAGMSRIFVGAEIEADGPIDHTTLITWFDKADGSSVENDSAPRVGNASIGTPAARMGAFWPVPAGAVWARIEAIAQSSAAGGVQLAMRHALICSVPAGQTAWPPFVPGPSSTDGADVTAVQPIVQLLDPTTGRGTTGLIIPTNWALGIKALQASAVSITQSNAGSTVTIHLPSVSYSIDNTASVTYPSADFPGLAYSTNYVIWRNDAAFNGGLSYGISSNLNDAYGIGKIAIATFTTMSSAGSGGGDTSSGSGVVGGGTRPTCPAIDMLVATNAGAQVAGDLREKIAGTALVALNTVNDVLGWAPLRSAEHHEVRCVRVVTANGAAQVMAWNTPVPAKEAADGYYYAHQTLGRTVPTLISGKLDWSEVTRAEPAGWRWVAHIDGDDCIFAAGEKEDAMILAHNKAVNTVD